jgi:bifunctional DNA-binding transcriptional regulator/antitoxin component of YhaV-PrlF toxin-antitoxin module
MDLHYLVDMASVLAAEANLTSQNQLTIPASFRKVMQLRGGVSRVRFEYADGGRVTLRVVQPGKTVRRDKTLQPFLDLLARDMSKNPRRIKPFPARLLAQAKAVVKGVDVDLDGPLAGDD